MAKRTVKARTRTAQPAKRSKAVARKTTPKKKVAAASKTSSKKAVKPARKAAAKRAPLAKKAGATKKKAAVVKKAAVRKAVAKKPVAKKPTARKPVTKKASAKTVKRPVKKVPPTSRMSSTEARRRELEEMVPSPPSSLDMKRRGSAVRTGRDEMAEHRADHATMTPSITGGDVDANVEDAYFTGDEAPGGDNPTPDQDIVDDIGKALGVEYQDNEELQGANKLEERDKHRWELDPASAEDYRDRDRE